NIGKAAVEQGLYMAQDLGLTGNPHEQARAEAVLILANQYKELEHGVRNANKAQQDGTAAADDAVEAHKTNAEAIKTESAAYDDQRRALQDAAGVCRSLADLNRDAVKDQAELTDAITK